jgi:hypothetical protein
MTNVVDLLQKLINHEKSARTIGNIAEAEAFAGKIQKLLFDNKLSMTEVEIREEEKNEPVGEEDVVAKTDGQYNGWLAMAVADFTFCDVLRGWRRNTLCFIGATGNRAACVAMFNYLSVLGEQLADSQVEQWKGTPEYYVARAEEPQWAARRYRASFLQGYVRALKQRLKVEHEKLVAGAQQAGNAMVYIDKAKNAVAAFVKVRYPHMRANYGSYYGSNSSAHDAGFAQGNRVSLSARAQLG